MLQIENKKKLLSIIAVLLTALLFVVFLFFRRETNIELFSVVGEIDGISDDFLELQLEGADFEEVGGSGIIIEKYVLRRSVDFLRELDEVKSSKEIEKERGELESKIAKSRKRGEYAGFFPVSVKKQEKVSRKVLKVGDLVKVYYYENEGIKMVLRIVIMKKKGVESLDLGSKSGLDDKNFIFQSVEDNFLIVKVMKRGMDGVEKFVETRKIEIDSDARIIRKELRDRDIYLKEIEDYKYQLRRNVVFSELKIPEEYNILNIQKEDLILGERLLIDFKDSEIGEVVENIEVYVE